MALSRPSYAVKQDIVLLPELREVVTEETLDEGLSCRCHFPPAPRQVLGQTPVETAPNLEVRIVQTAQDTVFLYFPFPDSQIPGLEQQGLAAERVHLELRNGVCIQHAVLQLHGADPLLRQQPVQVARFAGLEPVGLKLAPMEEMENVVRVVEPLIAEPVVAVVPCANPVPVQTFQFRGKYRVKVIVRVSADGRERRVQADVHEIVEPRGEAGLREHRDAGDEHEADVLFHILQYAVQVAQPVPVFSCSL